MHFINAKAQRRYEKSLTLRLGGIAFHRAFPKCSATTLIVLKYERKDQSEKNRRSQNE